MRKIAVVCDWLTVYAGAERCLTQILECYPEADLYSLVDYMGEQTRVKWLGGRKSKTSFLQHIPFGKKYYRYFLPFMPSAIRRLDLSSYDLIISSSHCVAKGVRTHANQLHVSYVHTPVRYAWDLRGQYLSNSQFRKGFKASLANGVLNYIKNWDYKTSQSIDHMIANSNYVKQRIYNCYKKPATVIHPPVDTTAFSFCSQKEDYYLTVSRMVPYKKMDMIVQAFSQMPARKLVVIGDGPEISKIKKYVAPNITLMGYQSFDVVKQYMQKAKAFIFAAEEDFGIVPVEAQACGTPVIAFGKGGILDTVRNHNEPEPTGIFFDRQTVHSLMEAMDLFESNEHKITPSFCRKNAEQFTASIFNDRFTSYVEAAWSGQP